MTVISFILAHIRFFVNHLSPGRHFMKRNVVARLPLTILYHYYFSAAAAHLSMASSSRRKRDDRGEEYDSKRHSGSDNEGSLSLQELNTQYEGKYSK